MVAVLCPGLGVNKGGDVPLQYKQEHTMYDPLQCRYKYNTLTMNNLCLLVADANYIHVNTTNTPPSTTNHFHVPQPV